LWISSRLAQISTDTTANMSQESELAKYMQCLRRPPGLDPAVGVAQQAESHQQLSHADQLDVPSPQFQPQIPDGRIYPQTTFPMPQSRGLAQGILQGDRSAFGTLTNILSVRILPWPPPGQFSEVSYRTDYQTRGDGRTDKQHRGFPTQVHCIHQQGLRRGKRTVPVCVVSRFRRFANFRELTRKLTRSSASSKVCRGSQPVG